MKKLRIKVNLDNCIGCRLCEAICSTIQYPIGIINYLKSAIHIQYDQFYRKDTAIICFQCEKAYCVDNCTSGALFFERGIVKYNPDCCDGCKKCIEACPLKAIWFIPETGKIVKCDLCANYSGPKCIKICPVNAIALFEKKPNRTD